MDEDSVYGLDYYGLVKTRHKVFCLSMLGKSIKECLGVSYLVMKIATRVPGERPISPIG